ncbi:hypothetical protein [Pontibacter roseus]|uniref:hypothetical protein n=1 Tax=Pontibacter roseus TaxID=336989 RepID=UPI00037EB5CA|nr:hypothetical protein [Pontibacter roseus]
MKKTLLLLTSTFTLLTLHTAQGQQAAIPRLEVAKGETYVVHENNILVVDTLIMHDKATIKFASDLPAELGARMAYVGDNCLITTKGADGKNSKASKLGLASLPGRPGTAAETGKPSTDGEDGGHLELDMHFMELGRLTIDTRGGKGGNGAKGANGRRPISESNNQIGYGNNTARYLVSGDPSTNGKPGTPGGFGGNGGNVKLTYSTHNFTPSFNQPQNHRSITILYRGGENGVSGKAGKSYINHDIAVEAIPVAAVKKNSLDGIVS